MTRIPEKHIKSCINFTACMNNCINTLLKYIKDLTESLQEQAFVIIAKNEDKNFCKM